MSWAPGSEIDGRYRLEAKIGEGGMGEVWRARHLALEGEVAIKFLGAQLAGNVETKERFLHEARLTNRLKTRHAVQVFDYGVTEGEPFLVMELLHGEPLSRRIERGRLDAATTVTFLRDAARALKKAHELGIVHRDFKPDNVFLTEGEDGQVEVKVVDFGIAKLIGSLENTRPTDLDLSLLTEKAHLTRTGRMVGTPHYMGPEQVRMDADIGPPADIWALGIVAYECLTGRCPFDGDNVLELFTNVQLYRFTPGTQVLPSLPAAFDEWFQTVCALDATKRFKDAVLAVDALAEAILPLGSAELAAFDHTMGGRGARPDSADDRVAPAMSSPQAAVGYDTDGGHPRKATLLDATVPVRTASSKGAWMVVAVCALAAGGLGLSRALQHGHDGGSVANGGRMGAAKNDVVIVDAGAFPALATEDSTGSAPSIARDPKAAAPSVASDAGVSGNTAAAQLVASATAASATAANASRREPHAAVDAHKPAHDAETTTPPAASASAPAPKPKGPMELGDIGL